MLNILNLLSSLKGGQPNMLLNNFMQSNMGYQKEPANNSSMNNTRYNNSNYNYPHANKPAPPQNTIDNNYPYGQFPHKYTKRGQELLKEEFLNRGKEPSYDSPHYNQNTANAFLKENIYPNQNFYTQNSYDDVNVLNQQKNQTNAGLDINTLLPLLSNLNGQKNNNDLLKTLLPLMGNRGNMNINDLLKLINNNDTVKKSSIDDLKRV